MVAKGSAIRREDFMQIFSKRMFRDALLQVIGKIDQVGSGEYRDEQSLVLIINEFQRKQMIDSMNPSSVGYE